MILCFPFYVILSDLITPFFELHILAIFRVQDVLRVTHVSLSKTHKQTYYIFLIANIANGCDQHENKNKIIMVIKMNSNV